MALHAELLVDCKNSLGEGIQWNSADQRVYWTDIFGDSLWSCDESGGDLRQQDAPGGLCAFAFTRSNQMLAAFRDGLCWFDPATGTREMITPYQPDLTRTRMNDGNLDRQGRFVVGGIDEEAQAPITPVWRVDDSGATQLFEEVGIANSIVFSPDGTKMYFADSTGQDIFVFDYDPSSGTPSGRRVLVSVPPERGVPDGSTVDAEGRLWNACFGDQPGLGYVHGYLPDGTLAETITLGAPQVTCCALGGRDLTRLFITSARIGMSDEAIAAAPGSGGLFVVDLPYPGLEHGRFEFADALKGRAA